MIYGVGCDVVSIPRIQKLIEQYHHSFLDKIFSKLEQEKAFSRKNSIHAFAKIFAVKEAFIKALGGSFGMSWHDVQILNDDLGRPCVFLEGKAKSVLKNVLGNHYKIHLSISDEPPYAMAYLIIEKQNN